MCDSAALHTECCGAVPTISTQTFFVIPSLDLYPVPMKQLLPPSYFPSAPGNLIALTVSVNLPVLGASWKWNHALAFCLAYFTQLDAFRIHTFYSP